MSSRPSLRERFMAKFQPDPKTGCWNWVAATRGYRYGSIRAGPGSNKLIAAHRASWEIHVGKIPDGLCVCHKCDNGLCVNPEHLFLGTHHENMKDKVAKGRQVRPHFTKLTNESAGHIKRNYKRGSRQFGIPALAKKLGVHKSTVRQVVQGATWKAAE